MFELAYTTNTLLGEIADPHMGTREIAGTYVLARLSSEPTDWRRVNRAIIDRWGFAGLVRVKRLAEKMLATPTDGAAARGGEDA